MLEIIDCSTAREFVNELDPSHKRWSGNSWFNNWIFRGQADANWKLIPSALRSESEGAPKSIMVARKNGRKNRVDIIGYPPYFPDKSYESTRIQELLYQLSAEITNLRSFLHLGDSLNLTTMRPDDAEVETYGTEFVKRYFSNIERPDFHESIWGYEAFAIGQHHGLPTRLLDWTKNPLYAAYFATEGVSENNIAVYAIDNRSLRGNSTIRFIEVGKSHSPYIHAQEGVFTLDSRADIHFLETGIWRSTLDALGGTIYKLTLPASEVPELLRILWLKRVTKAHMMPILENVVHSVTLHIEHLLATE